MTTTTKTKLGFLTSLDAYNSPGRYYHTKEHIDECLSLLQKVKPRIENYHEMWLAILFHDVVYDTSYELGHVNEERSAMVASEFCSTPTEIKFVTNLIMVTKHSPQNPPRTLDERYMCDIDLSSLGATPEQFDINSANIRQEYKQYGDAFYISERIKILKRFLERPFVYYTRELGLLFESKAKLNLAREIANLQQQAAAV